MLKQIKNNSNNKKIPHMWTIYKYKSCFSFKFLFQITCTYFDTQLKNISNLHASSEEGKNNPNQKV